MSHDRPRPDATQQAPAARPGRRRGPRADLEDPRGAVLEAARARFAEHGYDGTKLRDVAADADVDVALVSYFFGNKDGLFAAAMALDANPAELVEDLIRDGTDGLGERLLRTFLNLWDTPETGDPLLGLLRSAASHQQSAALLRGFVERELLGRLATAIDTPQPELRAALAGSQMIGVIMARHVVRVEAIARSDPDTLVAAIGPTLQRYLTGDVALPD
jgi:AcrR family transcriptional regulator